jgi:ABC-type branched-subunit amino acid transport system ATPase component
VEAPTPEDRTDVRLQVRELSKNFGGVRALRSVSLDVAPGETLGLIGPNGSGKTTLVNCVSGVLTPSGGTVVFEGRDVTKWSRTRRARAGLARTYQSLRLFKGLTVAENVEAGLVRRADDRTSERQARVAAILDAHGLGELSGVPVADLSYGLQRRVEIARTLVSDPSMLLLDEPAAGLADEETAGLRDLLVATRARLGLSVLIIDHDVSFIMEISDRVTVLDDGRVLFSGSPQEVAQDPGVITAYLGTPPADAAHA